MAADLARLKNWLNFAGQLSEENSSGVVANLQHSLHSSGDEYICHGGWMIARITEFEQERLVLPAVGCFDKRTLFLPQLVL